MSDEIKEILDNERYRNKDGYVENINLLPDEIHKLLDYITNLKNQLQQKENIMKEVREKLLCYGETFDLKVHQEMQKELLEILDKGE